MLDKIIILGYSGHSSVVCEAAIMQGLDIGYYAALTESKINYYNLKYIGSESDPKNINKKSKYILAVGDNIIREKIAKNINSFGGKIISVIHPQSSISNNVKIGKGVFISKNVSINPSVSIGNYSIINTGSIIEHDCIIGNSSHIAPGAILTGGVNIGDRTLIGAGSVIREGVIIGNDVIIGAGSIVLNDIESKGTYIGNPVKKIK